MRAPDRKQMVLMMFMEMGGILPANAPKLCFGVPDYLDKLIREMKNEGLLTECKLKASYTQGSDSLKCLAITKKGVQWLIDNCSDTYGWLPYLSNIPFSLREFPNNNTQIRHIKAILASVMFSLAGIPTFKLNSSDVSSPKFLREYIACAKNMFEYNHMNVLNDFQSNAAKNNMFYFKWDLEKYLKISQGGTNQNKYITHVGILLYKHCSFFVYMTSSQGLTLKPSNIASAKLPAISRFVCSVSPEHFRTAGAPLSGIIFFKNVKEFKTLFIRLYTQFANETKRKQKSLKDVFVQLFAFPVEKIAVKIIKKVLNDNKFYKRTEDRLNNTHCDFRADEYGKLFYKDLPALSGVDMELLRIMKFVFGLEKKGCTASGRAKFCVICYPWQEEYYKAIFGDSAVYLKIKEN